MKINMGFIASCSEYVIHLHDLTDEQVSKVKELQKDLNDLKQWDQEEQSKIPYAPKMNFKYDPKSEETKLWSRQYDTWQDLPEVKAYHIECEKKWEELRNKYVVSGETIFDTTLELFTWHDEHSVSIDGYLNEDNFVAWLQIVVGIENVEVS